METYAILERIYHIILSKLYLTHWYNYMPLEAIEIFLTKVIDYERNSKDKSDCMESSIFTHIPANVQMNISVYLECMTTSRKNGKKI